MSSSWLKTWSISCFRLLFIELYIWIIDWENSFMTFIYLIHHYIRKLGAFHITFNRFNFYIVLFNSSFFFQLNILFMTLEEFLSSFISILFVPIPFHFSNLFLLYDILKNEFTGILIFKQSFLLNYWLYLVCRVLINSRFCPKLWSILHIIFFRTFEATLISSF